MKRTKTPIHSSHDSYSKTSFNHSILIFCVIAFIIAGMTGFLFRLGMAGYDIWHFELGNLRHAHSHLMFFSWAVPINLVFILKSLPAPSASSWSTTLMRVSARWTLILGCAAFPFFLFFGYRPVPFLGQYLPFSVMISGLVMLAWYVFFVAYIHQRKDIPNTLSLSFYDAALTLLFVSSLGAWGVAGVQFTGLENPLFGKALTHFFLANFTEGWCVLALLGLLFQLQKHRLENKTNRWLSVMPLFILFGAPLTFPFGISESLLTPSLMWTWRLGSLLTGSGLLLTLLVISKIDSTPKHFFWKLILILLFLKAGAQLLAGLWPQALQFDHHGFRILYLHILLLGAFSISLFWALIREFKLPIYLVNLFAGSALTVIISLTLLTPLWPAPWLIHQKLFIIATVALLPVLASSLVLFHLARHLPKRSFHSS